MRVRAPEDLDDRNVMLRADFLSALTEAIRNAREKEAIAQEESAWPPHR
jgi:hypothetical protein